MFESLTLNSPWILLAFLVFIVSSFVFKKEKSAYYMPHFSKSFEDKSPKSRLLALLQWLMIGFGIFALSDPLVTKSIETKKSNAIDIVLSLDTSGSMSLYGFNAQDYNQTRLGVVKEVVSEFIKTREDDRIGLVLFGTRAAVVSPLSFDTKAQINILKQVEVGVLGKSTALVDSLLAGIELLKKSQSKSKIIVLLSDGEDSSSKVQLEVVLKLAKKYKIKIYTIQIDKSQTDMMKVIASANGAKSFKALSKKDLKEVYKTIENLEKSELSYKTIKVQEHIFFYPLALSLFFGFTLLAKREELF